MTDTLGPQTHLQQLIPLAKAPLYLLERPLLRSSHVSRSVVCSRHRANAEEPVRMRQHTRHISLRGGQLPYTLVQASV